MGSAEGDSSKEFQDYMHERKDDPNQDENIKLRAARLGKHFIEYLLGGALEERLLIALRNVKREAAPAVFLLDLVAIYGLDEREWKTKAGIVGSEPRVKFGLIEGVDKRKSSQALREAESRLNSLLSPGQRPPNGLLHLYFLQQVKGKALSKMEIQFRKSFEEVLRLHGDFLRVIGMIGIETVLMARACLDLGSSRFRREVKSGIKHLLADKLKRSGQHAYGHSECTLCSSRLLYIFSQARLLFPPGEQYE